MAQQYQMQPSGGGSGSTIAIVFGSVVVLGLGGFLLYRSMQAGKASGGGLGNPFGPNIAGGGGDEGEGYSEDGSGGENPLLGTAKSAPYQRTEGGKLNRKIYKKDFKDKTFAGKALGFATMASPIGLVANVVTGRATEKVKSLWGDVFGRR